MRLFLPSLLVALFLMVGGGVQAQTWMQVSGVASDDVLNVRSGPGAEFEDVGDLLPNQRVAVLGYVDNGRWAQIAHHTGIGFVAARFLSEVPQAPTNQTGTGLHFVTGIPADDPDGGLVVRGGAGSNFPRLGVAPNGTNVHVIERVGDGRWAMIAYNTGVAWVGAQYLAPSPAGGQPAPQPSPQPTPQPQIAAGFPVNTLCRGTEPFWTLEIAPDGTVSYNSLINGPAPLTSLSQATGASPYSFIASPYSGLITDQICSDGMSDLSYTMSLVLNVPTQSGGTETRYGCCNVVPTGGQGQCTTDADCGGGEGCAVQSGQCLPFDQDDDGVLSLQFGGLDCDDQDNMIYPGAPEVADFIDNDCDGLVDEVATGGNGPEICGDGIDNDGNNMIDYEDPMCPSDLDGDGFIAYQAGGNDCDDYDPSTHPGAIDIPNDGIDSDCDGSDEVATGGNGAEICGDGIDNDGNNLIDWADPACPADFDGDGFITIFAGGDDCNDDSATTYPGAPDPLGGPDQNCDGVF